MHYKDGRYAIDADKSMDPTVNLNVLADYVRQLLFLRFCADGSSNLNAGPYDGETADD
jgi:hypothetical protein